MTYPPVQPGPSGDWPDPSWPSPQPYPNQAAQPNPVGYPPQSTPPMVGQPYPMYPAPAGNRGTNGLAIGAFVCALVGLITCGITSLAGAIMGHIARRQIRERGEEGDGLALAGIIIGWTVTGLSVAGLVYVFFAIVLAVQSASNTYDDQSGWDAAISAFNALAALIG